MAKSCGFRCFRSTEGRPSVRSSMRSGVESMLLWRRPGERSIISVGRPCNSRRFRRLCWMKPMRCWTWDLPRIWTLFWNRRLKSGRPRCSLPPCLHGSPPLPNAISRNRSRSRSLRSRSKPGPRRVSIKQPTLWPDSIRKRRWLAFWIWKLRSRLSCFAARGSKWMNSPPC